ncbi:hypothetical protein [Kaistia sp. UC242_56]
MADFAKYRALANRDGQDQIQLTGDGLNETAPQKKGSSLQAVE